MDGFDQSVNVKVIMATNRADTLDPALLRPGRLDRKIEFPSPDRRQKRLIFSVLTGKMNLSEEVDLEDYVSRYLRFIVTSFFGSACGSPQHTTHNTGPTSSRVPRSTPSARRRACRPCARTAT